MITYRAILDVPAHTLATVTRWLAAHRRKTDARPWQRAASARQQALLLLRWFKDAARLRLLAAEIGVSIATAYRYLHEAIDVVAAHAPNLHDVLAQALVEGWTHVCLDGTLVPTTQHHGSKNPSGADSWYSGKHHQHGGNVQVLADPTGFPVWVGSVEPGSRHDIVCARWHALPALYPAAAKGLRVLADKGYQSAGIGIFVPFRKNTAAHPDDQSRDQLITSMRAPAERANWLLKGTWKAQGRSGWTRGASPRSLPPHSRSPGCSVVLSDRAPHAPGEKTPLSPSQLPGIITT